MKIVVHCAHCGVTGLTHEPPHNAGPGGLALWIERRRQEARQGDRFHCACGAEMAYEVVDTSAAAEGVRPTDVTRPVLEEVAIEANVLTVRGRFLKGATLHVDGLETRLDEESVNAVALDPALLQGVSKEAPKRVTLLVSNEHGHRGPVATALLDLDGEDRVVRALARLQRS